MKTEINLNQRVKRLVQEELVSRMEANSSYSLRAFAKKLELDPSSLSKFLRGKREFAPKTLEKVLFQLGATEAQLKELKESGSDQLNFLELDQFKILSTWYYTSILEMIGMDNFKPSPKWISEQLEVPTQAIQMAIEKLFEVGAIRLDEEGSWVNNWENFSTALHLNVDEPSLREYQKQIRERAAKSIIEDSIDIKDHTSYELPMDSDLFIEIKEEIKNFRRSIAKKIEIESKKKDCVVNLNISLFSQTKLEKDND